MGPEGFPTTWGRAGGLKPDDLSGSFQSRPFYDSVYSTRIPTAVGEVLWRKYDGPELSPGMFNPTRMTDQPGKGSGVRNYSIRSLGQL